MRQHNITTIERPNKKTLYRVYIGRDNGKPIYKSSTNLQSMVKLVEKLNKEQDLGNKAMRKEQIDLLRHEHELIYAMTLCKDMNVSVLECVKYYKSHASTITNVQMKLEDAGTLYLENMERRRVSAATLASTKTKINQLVALHGEKSVSDVTRQHINDFVFKRKKPLSPKSANNLLGAFSTFFVWCIKEGYTATNPCVKIDRMMTVDAKREILSLDDMQTYLDYCNDNGYYRELICLVLQSFCGLRVTESASLKFKDISIFGTLDTVTLSAEGAKLKQQRINKIPPNAKVWLKIAFKGLKIDWKVQRGKRKDELVINYVNKKFSKLRAALLKDEELKIPTNSPRHSFASYHYAAYNDLQEVKAMMGHTESDTMFFRHYRTMVSQRRGSEYFKMVPTNG